MTGILDDLSLSEGDPLSRIPVLVLNEHLVPWLDKDDLRSLRLVNKHFSDLYRSIPRCLNIRLCLEAFQTLTTTCPEGECMAPGLSSSRFAHRYPLVTQVVLLSDARPLTRLQRGHAVAKLLRLLEGLCPSQRQLTLLDAHCHPDLGGISYPRAGAHGSDGGYIDGHPDDGGVGAVAKALAASLPNLTELRFNGVGREWSEAEWSEAGGGSTGGPRAADIVGRGGSTAAATVPSRAVLALNPLLRELSTALLQPASSSHWGSSRDSTTMTNDNNGCVADTGAPSSRGGGSGPVGLLSLCVDYSQPSVDRFEAELLDAHLPHLPLLLMCIDGGAAVRPPVAADAAPRYLILRHPTLGAADDPTTTAMVAAGPLLRLTSLELRGVAVHPVLLTGLSQLAMLTRLVLSVSCVRPYEPLIRSLPHLTRLTHLHLFLHEHSPAEERQVMAAAAGVAADGEKQQWWHRGGSLGDDGNPDCRPIQLVAAVSRCTNLVSLRMPGEDVGSQLQALPGLTHLATRQLGPWDLTQPHTRLRSLELTMTWPVHLARLLPSLPKLDTLLADMYVYAYDEDEDDDGNSGTASRVRCNSHRRRGSRTTREERGNGGGEVGCAAAGGSGAERLYEEMLEVASGLRGVHHVEFQLSVMREERWEWPRLVRVLARVRNLRGLTLRLPRRGSGPQLRAQHLTSLCRSLTGLRRLTLLVAHPTCVKLNAKALQALQELPFIQLVQLHLGGMWEGRRVAPNVRGRDAVNVARGRFSGSGGGGGDGDGDGDGSSRLRQTSSNAAANRPAGDALHSSRRTGRSGKQGKYGKGEGSASPGMAAPAWHRSNLETTATAVGPVRAARGGDGGTGVSTVMCVPPMLPGSEAARAVLAAARGLGCFYGNSKGQRQPRRGGDRHSGGGSGADHTDTDDSSADTDRDTDSVASSGGSDTGAASHQNNDAPSENDIGGSSSGGQGCSMSGSSGNDGSSVRTQGQVELQVDFLTAREAAQVNSVLRWERRPARVRAGLWPRWVWADLVNCFN